MFSFIFLIQAEFHFKNVDPEKFWQRYFAHDFKDIFLPFLTTDFVSAQAGRKIIHIGRYVFMVRTILQSAVKMGFD